MNLPIPKREQVSAKLEMVDDRFGLPDLMKNTPDKYPNSQTCGINHAVQAMEENRAKTAFGEEIMMAQRMFGRAMAQQIALEFEACRQVGRLPGPVSSSRLMMETLMGVDDYIGFEDYLNNPINDEKMYDFSKAVKDFK